MKNFPATIKQSPRNAVLTMKCELPGGQIHTLELKGFKGRERSQQYDQLFKLTEPHQQSLRHLTLAEMTFDPRNFSHIMSKFSSLNHLRIVNASYEAVHGRDPQMTIKNLDHLEVTQLSSQFPKVLKQCKIKRSFKAEFRQSPVNDDLDNFVDFLQSQPNIREMSLKIDAKRFLNTARNYPFRLTKLSIDNLYYDYIDPLAATHFLKQQSETLRELELRNAPRDTVLRCILEDLKLEKLEMGIAGLQNDLNFFHQFEKNKHLRTLVLHGRVTKVKEIISHYPAVETLKFIDWDAYEVTELIDHISSTLPNLKHLSLPDLPGIISKTQVFHSFKSLHVTNLDNAENLKFLIIYCPNLEALTISHAESGIIDNELVKFIVKKAKRLRKLCLGVDFELDEEGFNLVLRLANKLRMLIVYTENVEESLARGQLITDDKLKYIVLKSQKKTLLAERHITFNTTPYVDPLVRERTQEIMRLRLLRRRQMFQGLQEHGFHDFDF